MLRDTAVDILMGRLGQRTSALNQQSIINEMVVVQETLLEGKAEPYWFLLSEKSQAITVIDDERLPLPTTFLAEWEYGRLVVVEDDGSETALIKEDWDSVEELKLGSGKPKYYSAYGEYFLLSPTPDKNYTLKMRYYQREASLAGSYGSNNIENAWLKEASDLLIAEVGIIMSAQYLQSPQMTEVFFTQATAAKQRLQARDVYMRESNRFRYMEG